MSDIYDAVVKGDLLDTLRSIDGHPLANMCYHVRFDSTVIASGVTDSGGRTQRIATEGARRLTLEIVGGA